MDELRDKYAYSKLEDLYAAIGFGTIGVNKIIGRLLAMYKKANVEEEFEKKIKDIEKNGEKEEKKVSNKGNGKGLYVKGLDNLLIKTAKCCNPVPGDEIIRIYYTRKWYICP